MGVWSLGQEDPLGGGHGNPLQYSCQANSMDREPWWAMIHGVTKSWTGLKQLSMHTLMTYNTGRGLNPWYGMNAAITYPQSAHLCWHSLDWNYWTGLPCCEPGKNLHASEIHSLFTMPGGPCPLHLHLEIPTFLSGPSSNVKVKVKVAQLCPTLCDSKDYYSAWNSPAQNTGVGSLSLLQGIFPI